MDYDKFKKEYEQFEKWNSEKEKFWDNRKPTYEWTEDRNWLKLVDDISDNHNCVLPVNNDGEIQNPYQMNDMVNSPAHYTRGKQACIDTIEDAIQDAPDPVVGSCHGQILRYLLRLWLKDTPLKNAKKARWYLDRLISHLENQQR